MFCISLSAPDICKCEDTITEEEIRNLVQCRYCNSCLQRSAQGLLQSYSQALLLTYVGAQCQAGLRCQGLSQQQ